VNRPELVAAVAERTGRPRRDVDEVLRGVTEVVMAAVAAGEPVAISGFAKFAPVVRPARMGRNPRTGEAVPIPARRRVRVTVLKALKDTVASAATEYPNQGAGADGPDRDGDAGRTPDGEGDPVALTSATTPGDGADGHDVGRTVPEPAPARHGEGAEVALHASAPEPPARRHGQGVGPSAAGPAPEPVALAGPGPVCLTASAPVAGLLRAPGRWSVPGWCRSVLVAAAVAVAGALFLAPFLAEPGVLP